MASRQRDTMHTALIHLRRSGLFKNSKYPLKILSLYILSPLKLVVFGMMIAKLNGTKGDVEQIAEIFEGLAVFVQCLVRKYLLVRFGRDFDDILQIRKLFWHNVAEEEASSMLKPVLNIAKVLLILGGASVLWICFQFFYENKTSPLPCWTNDNSLVIWSIVFIQIVAMAELVNLLGGIDAFYIILCTELRLEFIILKKTITSIDFGREKEPECMKKLARCCQHHNLLLRTHQKLNKIFSHYFIVQYMITVLQVAIQFYIMAYGLGGIEGAVKSIVFVIALMFQVGMFFVPASDVEAEAEDFALQIYETNWEATGSTKIRKHVLFMLMRAQTSLYMLGAGTIHINRAEFVALFRLAFSISTLIGRMSEISERANT